MANWAKLQEDLTGLKVVKRAKHGIHFDKGGGQILAEFTGKPWTGTIGKLSEMYPKSVIRYGSYSRRQA